jgi:serine/threonine-protein kinase
MDPWGGPHDGGRGRSGGDPNETSSWRPTNLPPRRRQSSWLIAGVLAIVLLVTAALVISAMLGPTSDRRHPGLDIASTSATPTAANLAPDSLPGYLLTADEVSKRVQTPGMVAGTLTDALTADGAVAPPGCPNAWAPADRSTYQGSGYTGLARQSVLQDPRSDTAVVEAVIAFSDETTPRAIVEQMGATWDECTAQTFSADLGDGKPVTFVLGPPVANDDVTTMLVLPARSAPGPSCQRAVTARRNVVVDVLACSASLGDFGSTIADDIGKKIASAR